MILMKPRRNARFRTPPGGAGRDREGRQTRNIDCALYRIGASGCFLVSRGLIRLLHRPSLQAFRERGDFGTEADALAIKLRLTL